MSQFVVFATPAFDHKTTIGYTQSIINATIALNERGITWGFHFVGGDPYLAKVRNLMVATCLEAYPTMTDFFFIDADLEFDTEGVLKLLESPEPVVAGIYPKKNDNIEFPCELEVEDNRLIERDGWVKARAVPTGFLRIKRHVLEQMSAASGKYIDGTGGGKEARNIFQMGYCADNVAKTGYGEWWGEDYAWCKDYHGIQGQIWVWPNINFGHMGTKTWRANFQPYVDSGRAQLEEKRAADIGEKYAGDFTLSNVIEPEFVRRDSAA